MIEIPNNKNNVWRFAHLLYSWRYLCFGGVKLWFRFYDYSLLYILLWYSSCPSIPIGLTCMQNSTRWAHFCCFGNGLHVHTNTQFNKLNSIHWFVIFCFLSESTTKRVISLLVANRLIRSWKFQILADLHMEHESKWNETNLINKFANHIDTLMEELKDRKIYIHRKPSEKSSFTLAIKFMTNNTIISFHSLFISSNIASKNQHFYQNIE